MSEMPVEAASGEEGPPVAARRAFWRSIPLGIGLLAVLPLAGLFALVASGARAGAAEILFAAAIALLGLIALMLYGVRVGRDLRRVTAGIAAMEAPASGPKLAVSGAEEIRDATRALNRAAQILHGRIDSLQESEARFHAIADYTFGAELWFGPKGQLIWVNRSIERVTGFSPLECALAGNLIETLVYQKDRKFAKEAATAALEGTAGSNLELRLQKKGGGVVWVMVNWQPIYDTAGEYMGLRVSIDEIQARKEAELKLLESVAELRRAQSLKEYYLTRSNEERLRLEALLDVMKIGVLFVDRDHRVRYCNQALFSILGLDPHDTLTGVRDQVLLDRVAGRAADPSGYRRHVDEILAHRETSTAFDIVLRNDRVVSDVSALVLSPEPGHYLGRVWTYEDVTEQRLFAERLTQMAERDPLTNLYNRRRFNEEVERMIADASRRGVQLGLLMIDLDGFKPINDEFGHQAGDEVLIGLAREVGAAVRRNEIFFRLGGDEFAILAPDADEAEMEGMARRVGAKIAGLRFAFGSSERGVTASIGIALYPRDADSADELLAGADHAMYAAKAGGKSGWEIYRRPPPLRNTA